MYINFEILARGKKHKLGQVHNPNRRVRASGTWSYFQFPFHLLAPPDILAQVAIQLALIAHFSIDPIT